MEGGRPGELYLARSYCRPRRMVMLQREHRTPDHLDQYEGANVLLRLEDLTL